MIFTDTFVYIHQPKTGGTFVTTALKTIHRKGDRRNLPTRLWNAVRGLQRPKPPLHLYTNKYGRLVQWNKHGTCAEIPGSHRGKRILASVRNPYDQYVSQYEFGWWKRKEYLRYFRAVPEFQKAHPNFPDISFEQYVLLINRAFCENGQSGRGVGFHTTEFVRFYFRDPPKALSELDEVYVASRKYEDDMCDVHFIRTDQLNSELYQFLLSVGYQREDIEFILGLGKIVYRGKGRSAEQKWEKYYTPELKQFVRTRERLLFKMFPEFDEPRAEAPQALVRGAGSSQ